MDKDTYDALRAMGRAINMFDAILSKNDSSQHELDKTLKVMESALDKINPLKCDNCGAPGFETKDDYAWEIHGDDIDVIFCETCDQNNRDDI